MKVNAKQLLASDVWTHLDRVTHIADRVTLTSGAAAKGAYVQLDAALARDTYAWVIAVMNKAGAGVTELTVDLATGAAASEVDFIDDLPAIGAAGGTEMYATYFIPCFKAATNRIAARCGITNGGSVEVSVWGISA